MTNSLGYLQERFNKVHGLALLEGAMLTTFIVPLVITTYAIIDYLDLRRQVDAAVTYEVAALNNQSHRMLSGYQDTWLYLSSEEITNNVDAATAKLGSTLLDLSGSQQNFYAEIGFISFQISPLTGKIGHLASLGNHVDDEDGSDIDGHDGVYTKSIGTLALSSSDQNLADLLTEQYPIQSEAEVSDSSTASYAAIPTALRGIPPTYGSLDSYSDDPSAAKQMADQLGASDLYQARFGASTYTLGHHQSNYMRNSVIGGVLVIVDFKDTHVGQVMSALGMSTTMKKFLSFPLRMNF